jgi:hypothetical protein
MFSPIRLSIIYSSPGLRSWPGNDDDCEALGILKADPCIPTPCVRSYDSSSSHSRASFPRIDVHNIKRWCKQRKCPAERSTQAHLLSVRATIHDLRRYITQTLPTTAINANHTVNLGISAENDVRKDAISTASFTIHGWDDLYEY